MQHFQVWSPIPKSGDSRISYNFNFLCTIFLHQISYFTSWSPTSKKLVHTYYRTQKFHHMTFSRIRKVGSFATGKFREFLVRNCPGNLTYWLMQTKLDIFHWSGDSRFVNALLKLHIRNRGNLCKCQNFLFYMYSNSYLDSSFTHIYGHRLIMRRRHTGTVICLIRAPGALARSDLIGWGESCCFQLSNGGFGLKIGQILKKPCQF